MNDSIYYARGAQTVRVVPVDRAGSPRVVSSATYSIVDLREAEGTTNRDVVSSTAATASSVSTTISADAGPTTANPRLVTLTSASGVRVGGVYLLRSGATEEAVTVGALNGTEVETTRPITRDFDDGASWLGLELEGTFTSDVAADELRLEHGGGPFQVTWVYTISGELYVTPRELWLTRYGVAPWVLPDHVFRHFPSLASSTGALNDVRQAIAAATDDFAEHLISTGSWRRDPAYFRGNLSADLAVRKRALMYLCRWSRSEPLLEQAAAFEAEARQHMNNLTEGRPGSRAVVVEPVEDLVDSKAAAGGYFAPG